MNSSRVLILIGVAVALGIFFWFDLGSYVTLSNLQSQRAFLVEQYHAYPVIFLTLFVIVYILQTALALPGAAILSLAAGAIFGPVTGTIAAVSAATAGATVSLVLTRYLARDFVMKRFGNKLAPINQELEKRGINYLLFLRLVPVFPFFLVNLAAAMTTIPLGTFVASTAVGILPAGFVFIQTGAAVGQISSVSDVMSGKLIASLAALGIVAMIPVVYARLKDTRK